MSESLKPGNGRKMLLLLAVLFFAPVIGAKIWLSYVSGQEGGVATSNFGTLIHPARPLPPLEYETVKAGYHEKLFEEKWTVLIVAATPCAEECQEILYRTRQIRTLLDRRRVRVQRVVAFQNAPNADLQGLLEEFHPDLAAIVAKPDLPAFFAKSPQPIPKNGVYIIDPLGNWLMQYTPEFENKELHKDLKKLLKVSQIG